MNNSLEDMIKLVTALEDSPRWRDGTFSFGTLIKVTCKPVFYVKPKIYDCLYYNSCLRAIIDENHLFLGDYGDPASFMGIEVRIVEDSPKVADYALAFEPVQTVHKETAAC